MAAWPNRLILLIRRETMLPEEYERLFQNEDQYWWYVSRRELVTGLIDRLPLVSRGGRAVLLDVGCGTGATTDALRRHGTVIGVDPSPLALEACTRRALANLVQGTAESLPMKDGVVDVIVATDILEHLEDDRAALAEFFRVLRPGGYAVVTVPAYRFLWSDHDRALMHKRRYVAGELLERSRDAGFRVVQGSYAVCFLLPLALGRLLRKRSRADQPPRAQITPVPRWLNTLLIRLQRVEAAMVRRMSLPWGLTVLAVLQKPASLPSPSDPAGATRPVDRVNITGLPSPPVKLRADFRLSN